MCCTPTFQFERINLVEISYFLANPWPVFLGPRFYFFRKLSRLANMFCTWALPAADDHVLDRVDPRLPF